MLAMSTGKRPWRHLFMDCIDQRTQQVAQRKKEYRHMVSKFCLTVICDQDGLVPRPPPFFSFVSHSHLIIHKSGRAIKNEGDLGMSTRLHACIGKYA